MFRNSGSEEIGKIYDCLDRPVQFLDAQLIQQDCEHQRYNQVRDNLAQRDHDGIDHDLSDVTHLEHVLEVCESHERRLPHAQAMVEILERHHDAEHRHNVEKHQPDNCRYQHYVIMLQELFVEHIPALLQVYEVFIC